MSGKHKGMVNDHGRSVAREKMVPVAPGSQQGKPPGSGAGATSGGSLQSGNLGGGGGGRGGAGSQQGGWSARQRAQRMQARAEQDRLGLQQQAGYGGNEQSRHGGSEGSALSPSSQSGDAGKDRGHPEQPGSSYASKTDDKGGSSQG